MPGDSGTVSARSSALHLVALAVVLGGCSSAGNEPAGPGHAGNETGSDATNAGVASPEPSAGLTDATGLVVLTVDGNLYPFRFRLS